MKHSNIEKPGQAARLLGIIAIALLTIPQHSKAQIPPARMPFHSRSVEITGDVKIILTNTPGNFLLIKGAPAELESVETMVADGRLRVDASRGGFPSTLTVYLAVDEISTLIVNGKAEIFSSGRVRTRDLEIILNGPSLVGIFHEGKLKVIAAEERPDEKG